MLDIEEHMASLSDDDLKAALKVAADDLAEAAAGGDPEWHGACFAGAVLYANEMNKRGLSLATKH